VDQLQLREGRWVIVGLEGRGGSLRTVLMPALCKDLLDHRLNDSGVEEGKVFRRILKNGRLQDPGVTAYVVWDVVKRCAKNGGIDHLSPHDMRRSCARFCHEPGGELERIKFLLGSFLNTNDGVLYRMQAKAERSSQRSIPNLAHVTSVLWTYELPSDKAAYRGLFLLF
jgi:integrase